MKAALPLKNAVFSKEKKKDKQQTLGGEACSMVSEKHNRG